MPSRLIRWLVPLWLSLLLAATWSAPRRPSAETPPSIQYVQPSAAATEPSAAGAGPLALVAAAFADTPPPLAREQELAGSVVPAAQEAIGFAWQLNAWATNHRITELSPSPEPGTPSALTLPQWSFVQLTGEERNGQLFVRYAGDGRALPPRKGWIAAADLQPTEPALEAELPWGYPATTQVDALRIHVPYRTQLDGSPWEGANCGPTTLGMGLEALGIEVSSAQLRREVLDAQGLWGNDVGVYMEALARVGAGHGARVLDLFQGRALKRWSLDDIRAHLHAGQPVILQVRFRALPGHQGAPYYGDHFIIVTGLVGDDFLYNDPIDSDGLGYDRLMTPAELQRAMNANDRKYAYAGFALAGP